MDQAFFDLIAHPSVSLQRSTDRVFKAPIHYPLSCESGTGVLAAGGRWGGRGRSGRAERVRAAPHGDDDVRAPSEGLINRLGSGSHQGDSTLPEDLDRMRRDALGGGTSAALTIHIVPRKGATEGLGHLAPATVPDASEEYPRPLQRSSLPRRCPVSSFPQ